MGRLSTGRPATLTYHQQGSHALDHDPIVLRVRNYRLREVAGISASNVESPQGVDSLNALIGYVEIGTYASFKWYTSHLLRGYVELF